MEPRATPRHLTKASIAYALASVLGLAFMGGLEKPLTYFDAERMGQLFLGPDPVSGLVWGLGAGAVMAGIGEALTRLTAWGRRLSRVLSSLVGGLGVGDAIMLALLSSFCEELLFRGIAMPYLTLVGSSLIFGLAHFVPRKGLWPWSVWAVFAGLALGQLALYTGGLFAPFTAHFVVNAVGLTLLSRRSRRAASVR